MRHALLHRGAVARAKSGSKTAKHGADAGRHTKKASLDGAKTSLKEAQKLHDVMVRGYNKAQAVVDKAGGLTKASTSQKRRLLVAERNMNMQEESVDSSARYLRATRSAQLAGGRGRISNQAGPFPGHARTGHLKSSPTE
tara:strand:+ start:1078 stop:1497 length:420 start_codon:yes stop_codon:yes gene_type:complete